MAEAQDIRCMLTDDYVQGVFWSSKVAINNILELSLIQILVTLSDRVTEKPEVSSKSGPVKCMKVREEDNKEKFIIKM